MNINKHILSYGLLLGSLILVLRLVNYRFLIYENSVEMYGGLVAVIFTGLGIWLGLKLTRKKGTIQNNTNGQAFEVERVSSSEYDQEKLSKLSITPREYEILTLITSGMSNQEISDKLFVSVNTIKTHSSRLFDKLEVKRRTQAVQKAKEFGLIK